MIEQQIHRESFNKMTSTGKFYEISLFVSFNGSQNFLFLLCRFFLPQSWDFLRFYFLLRRYWSQESRDNKKLFLLCIKRKKKKEEKARKRADNIKRENKKFVERRMNSLTELISEYEGNVFGSRHVSTFRMRFEVQLTQTDFLLTFLVILGFLCLPFFLSHSLRDLRLFFTFSSQTWGVWEMKRDFFLLRRWKKRRQNEKVYCLSETFFSPSVVKGTYKKSSSSSPSRWMENFASRGFLAV